MDRPTREANRKSRKLFPLVKITERHGGVPIHLTCLILSQMLSDIFYVKVFVISQLALEGHSF